MISEERKKSYMTGSKTVNVKKKCRLGGLGNTSVACNQGDTNNLEFGSVNEEIDPSEAYNDIGGLQTIIDGKRDVGFIRVNDNNLPKILGAGLNMIGPIFQIDHGGYSLNHHIIHRDINKAKELYEILQKNHGYLPTNSSEETRRIGELLGYRKEAIDIFVEKKFNKEKQLAEEVSTVNEVVAKTQEEVDSFISDSKVKETVYHGSPVGGIEDFSLKNSENFVTSSGLREDGMYFTSNPDLADIYKNGRQINPEFKSDIEHHIRVLRERQITVRNNREYDEIEDEIKRLENRLVGQTYGVKLNIKKPLIFDAKGKINSISGSGWYELEIDLGYKIATGKEAIQLIATKNDVAKDYWKYDGIIAKNIIDLDHHTNNSSSNYDNEHIGNAYVVFSPNQILILEPELMNNEVPVSEDVDTKGKKIVTEEVALESGFVDGWNRYGINNDGVEVGVIEVSNRENYMILNKIFIHPEHRQLGYADEVMKILFDYANQNKKIIALTPDNVWGANKEKLKKWYKSLGFVVNKGRNKDFEVRELMIKKPNNLEINEYFSSLVPMNENEIMSLQDLPFRKEVEQLGGKIFSVGGAVRDEFLGKESKDLDILITGIPMDNLEQLLSKYGGVNKVGESFGVLKFVPEGSKEEIDVAIPRTEVATGDGGHKGFDVTSDHELPIEKDLERRDFTINAIAKDIEGNLIDPYNGQEDLKNKIIRIVNPEAFSDDPLRMLRAIQFSSRFGFTIEPTTMQMIIDNAAKVTEIAAERILIELDKILKKGDILRGVQLLSSTGLFKQIFGNEIQKSQIERRNFGGVRTMAELLFLMMDGVVQNPPEFYLKRFSTGDAKRDKIYKELQALDLAFNSTLVDGQMNHVKARSIAHNIYSIAPQTLESQILPEIISVAGKELLQDKYPKTVNDLAINGNDIMEKGFKGRDIGKMQKSMLIQIYADEVRNNKEELISLIDNKSNYNEIQENFNDSQRVQTWNVNDKLVGIDFFVNKYDKWNNQNDEPSYGSASNASVLEFLQNNYEDFSNDNKLKKSLYWALTDRDLLGEEEVKKVSYSAVVINDESRTKLIQVFQRMIPEGWEIIAHHMTIKMGALEDGSKEKQDMEDGTEVQLNVTDYAIDDKVMAVGVKGYETSNEKPHITMAVNRAEGGKPFFSNKLTDWRKIGFSFEVKGKVEEV